MNMTGISATSSHQAGFYTLPIIPQSLFNVTRDNEIWLNQTFLGADSNFWRYNVSVNLMEMSVPSHGQVPLGSPLVIVGLPNLRVVNATFVKN